MHISSWSSIQQISNGFQFFFSILCPAQKFISLNDVLKAILNKNFFPISRSDHFLDDVFKTLNFHAALTEEHKKLI